MSIDAWGGLGNDGAPAGVCRCPDSVASAGMPRSLSIYPYSQDTPRRTHSPGSLPSVAASASRRTSSCAFDNHSLHGLPAAPHHPDSGRQDSPLANGSAPGSPHRRPSKLSGAPSLRYALRKAKHPRTLAFRGTSHPDHGRPARSGRSPSRNHRREAARRGQR